MRAACWLGPAGTGTEPATPGERRRSPIVAAPPAPAHATTPQCTGARSAWIGVGAIGYSKLEDFEEYLPQSLSRSTLRSMPATKA